MLVVEIDGLNAESLEAPIARGTDVLRFAADAANIWIGFAANDAEFRSDEILVALSAGSAADQLFVVAVPIHVRGVEEIDAKFESAVNRGHGLSVVATAVKVRHTHATEAKGGDEWSVFSKLTSFHEFSRIGLLTKMRRLVSRVRGNGTGLGRDLPAKENMRRRAWTRTKRVNYSERDMSGER